MWGLLAEEAEPSWPAWVGPVFAAPFWLLIAYLAFRHWRKTSSSERAQAARERLALRKFGTERVDDQDRESEFGLNLVFALITGVALLIPLALATFAVVSAVPLFRAGAYDLELPAGTGGEARTIRCQPIDNILPLGLWVRYYDTQCRRSDEQRLGAGVVNRGTWSFAAGAAALGLIGFYVEWYERNDPDSEETPEPLLE